MEYHDEKEGKKESTESIDVRTKLTSSKPSMPDARILITQCSPRDWQLTGSNKKKGFDGKWNHNSTLATH